MNSKILAGIVIAVVAVSLWMFNKDEESPITDTVENNTTTTTSTNNVPGVTGSTASKPTAVKGLLSEKGNFFCSYEQSSQNLSSKSTFYMSKGKIRAEFRVKTPTVTTVSIMLYDGSNLYVWQEGMAVGKVTQPKLVSDLEKLLPKDITSAAVLGTNPNNLNYECRPWLVDEKLLVKPSYVQFTK
jgi:hypothetical protein